MTLKNLRRIYALSDASLKQFADLIKLFVTRDLTDFTTRGVTQSTIDDLADLIEAFDDLPTDPELLGPVMAATETKNALAEQLKIAIRPIRSMAELKYKSMGNYHNFGFKNMDKLNDDELRRMAKRVVAQGTALLSELASEGLTQAMLTALNATLGQFDDAIDNQAYLIAARDRGTEARISAGNVLYAEVARLCAIGQSLYIDTDPARYNDYIIYGSSATRPSLKGLVQDSASHEALPDATVDIPAAGITKITNAEGKFEVHVLEAGGYDVNVTHPEYAPQTLPVTIIEDETTEVEVNLVHE